MKSNESLFNDKLEDTQIRVIPIKTNDNFIFERYYYDVIKTVDAYSQPYLWRAFMDYVFYGIDDSINLCNESEKAFTLLKEYYHNESI